MKLPHVALATGTAQGQSVWRQKRDNFNKSLIAAAASAPLSLSQVSHASFPPRCKSMYLQVVSRGRMRC